jgi:hypothetical protein
LGRDLHLILEAHVVLDVLPGHADVVRDLVDLVALLGARQDAGAAQAVDGRMVSVVGLDVPIVLLPGRQSILSNGDISPVLPGCRQATRDDGLAAYDEILRQFQVSQGLPTRLRGS